MPFRMATSLFVLRNIRDADVKAIRARTGPWLAAVVLSSGVLAGVILSADGVADGQRSTRSTQSPPSAQDRQRASRVPDIYFVATRQAVADAMLQLAGVTANDVVYDLG